MNFDPVIISIPIFFFLIALELFYNWYRVKKKGEKSLYRINDSLSNIGCGILDQLTSVFAKVFVIGAYTLVFNWSTSFIPFEIPSNWLLYIVFFLAVDMLYYFAHRMSHEVNFMWLGHVVHHQSEEYNLSVALRQGSVQKLMTFWVYFPLAFLGFPPTWFLIAMGFNLLYQFWIHTEVINKMGWFELIMNTPSHHRVHHGRNPKYIDKNHAGVFIIWDKMFGTFQKEEERPTYGITNPTKTFNPLKAHVQPFVRMFDGLKNHLGFKNKMQFVFKGPGWIGENLIVKEKPFKAESIVKFDFTVKTKVNIYLLVQFVVNMGIGAYALNVIDQLTQPQKIIFLLHSLLYLLSIGLAFDRKKVAFALEVLRHLLNVLIGVVFLGYFTEVAHVIAPSAEGSSLDINYTFVGIVTISFTVFSLIWLSVINRKNLD